MTKEVTFVGLIVLTSAAIEKTKGYHEEYHSIRQPSIGVKYNSFVISSSLFISLFSEVHFSITDEMYVNTGIIPERF